MPVKDTDKGWKELKQNLRLMKGASIQVGVIGAKARQDHPNGKGATMADIATFNEFGTSTVPARSFIRSTFDENQNYQNFAIGILKLVMRGKRDARTGLKLIGTRIQSDIARKIDTLKTPSNSPATVARKGSSNPLVDTSRLKRSIEYEVKT